MLRNVKFLVGIGRTYHSTRVLAAKRDFGVRHRLKMAKDDERNTVEMLEDDPEFDPDSDFFRADLSHKQHQQEMSNYNEKLSRWIVRDKYFKRKYPNFLTWAEKEHIRHLHEKDPDEWNIHHINESFPIDIHHIKKLLRNKWSPKDAKRVEKHDLSVKQNWEKFRNGEFDDILPPNVRTHLMKFKDREINLDALPKFEPKMRLSASIKTKNDEFLKIITSCKKYQQIEEPSERQETKKVASKFDAKRTRDPPNSKLLMNAKEINMNKRMTLEELKFLLGDQEQMEQKPIVIDEKQLALHSKENPSGTGIISRKKMSEMEVDFPEKFDKRVLSQKELTRAMAITPVKEHIRIPKKLWRKNATYKYKDCFYDDDGELLYRVPGLTK